MLETLADQHTCASDSKKQKGFAPTNITSSLVSTKCKQYAQQPVLSLSDPPSLYRVDCTGRCLPPGNRFCAVVPSPSTINYYFRVPRVLCALSDANKCFGFEKTSETVVDPTTYYGMSDEPRSSTFNAPSPKITCLIYTRILYRVTNPLKFAKSNSP